ncbi:hypothetical protein PHSY_002079 [Pseudozyma hubeiensis SY62]|uniref:Uncharacterized protein n=1 Tax=Pseudozyma hubeiensis (strain SY62) TaxID=1305764 RepID=R9P0F2_PSEHS|nr:hypothetical protein PHSY_002079 [Pseudozyma hubeiensis SY62]GAC94507.1 hypothetical protein PHSY_002079 [Pseudozyma hubeiensis SY62]
MRQALTARTDTAHSLATVSTPPTIIILGHRAVCAIAIAGDAAQRSCGYRSAARRASASIRTAERTFERNRNQHKPHCERSGSIVKRTDNESSTPLKLSFDRWQSCIAQSFSCARRARPYYHQHRSCFAKCCTEHKSVLELSHTTSNGCIDVFHSDIACCSYHIESSAQPSTANLHCTSEPRAVSIAIAIAVSTDSTKSRLSALASVVDRVRRITSSSLSLHFCSSVRASSAHLAIRVLFSLSTPSPHRLVSTHHCPHSRPTIAPEGQASRISTRLARMSEMQRYWLQAR